MSKVLIADDERSICEAFSDVLRREGHTPLVASNGAEALEVIRRDDPEVVFLDVRMPDMDGLTALAEIHARYPGLPVIVMTAYGTMQTAMQAMQQGAFDYLGKPVDLQRIRDLLRRALERRRAVEAESPVALPASDMEQEMVGQSAAMQEIFKLMSLLTGNDLTVLITGESGVGKELAARGIHDHSPRAGRPFVTVNCTAVPENLLESELFGHERGAFTSADARRIGRFEAAADGTVFLDEIGELPTHLQSKLLRVLQERSFERVGSVTPIAVRARVIAATNRNLELEVREGRFREDLYYRLKLVALEIPPLRRRREDIEPLALRFLSVGNRELGRDIKGIDPAALQRLRAHSWPGNVRELENTVKRALLTAGGPVLTVHDLVLEAQPAAAGDDRDLEALRTSVQRALHDLLAEHGDAARDADVYRTLVQFVEAEIIAEALRVTGGNQVAAAQLLGMHRTTLRNKLAASVEPNKPEGEG